MSEEPTTPTERARFILSRIESAMHDFERMYPRLPATPKKFGEPSRMGRDLTPVFCFREVDGQQKLVSSGARRVPAAEVDWTLDRPRQRQTTEALSDALAAYVEGRLSIDDVKTVYQRFADAHLVYWLDGRMIGDEFAAQVAALERQNEEARILAQTPDSATLAHTSGGVAKQGRRPRLAYSRGRAQIND